MASDNPLIESPADAPPKLFLHQFALLADRYRYFLYAFIAGMFLLGFTGTWRPESDAALHLSLARNLVEGKGYTYLGLPHKLAYPGLPWIIAGTFKIFGTASLVPIHIIILLTTFATLALVYRLFARYADRPTAVVITLGLAVCKTFFGYAYEIRSDMPFTMGVMAFLCGYEYIFHRQSDQSKATWFDWFLLVGGLLLAIVMRPAMWGLLAALTLTLFIYALRGRLHWKRLVWIVALAVTVVVIVRVVDPRRASSETSVDAYEGELVREYVNNFSAVVRTTLTDYLPQMISYELPDAVFQFKKRPMSDVLSIIVLVLGIGLIRRRKLWGLWVLCTTIIIVLVDPVARYFVPILPMLLYGWWLGLCWLNRTISPRWGNLVCIALLLGGVINNWTKSGGIIVQQRQWKSLGFKQSGLRPELRQLAKPLAESTPPNAWILAGKSEGRILSWLAHRQVGDYRELTTFRLREDNAYVVLPIGPEGEQLMKDAKVVPGELVKSTVAGGKTREIRTLVPIAGSGPLSLRERVGVRANEKNDVVFTKHIAPSVGPHSVPLPEGEGEMR